MAIWNPWHGCHEISAASKIKNMWQIKGKCAILMVFLIKWLQMTRIWSGKQVKALYGSAAVCP